MLEHVEQIQEGSTRAFYIVLKNQYTAEVVVPTGMLWTLVDTSGAIINLKEQVAIAEIDLGAAEDSMGQAATIVLLSGADLKIPTLVTSDTVERHLVIEATFSSSYGTDLPVTEYIKFNIENIPYIEA